MVNKFKVGDRVKIVRVDPAYEGNTAQTRVGKVGVITAIDIYEDEYPYKIDVGDDHPILWNDSEIESAEIMIDRDGNIW